LAVRAAHTRASTTSQRCSIDSTADLVTRERSVMLRSRSGDVLVDRRHEP
jgi:hypothetical protein